jgi:hypothetical protein
MVIPVKNANIGRYQSIRLDARSLNNTANRHDFGLFSVTSACFVSSFYNSKYSSALPPLYGEKKESQPEQPGEVVLFL